MLVEVALSCLILTLAVAALVPSFLVILKGNVRTAKLMTAKGLTTELLEEVRLRKWDENTPLPISYASSPVGTLGIDGAESASDKRTFDDLDDFNGWVEASPLDPVMRALPAFPKYRRTVAVAFVTSALAVSGTATDYKRITVCTTPEGMSAVCQSTVLTNR